MSDRGGNKILDTNGFNNWSGQYDESILESSDRYPFLGYYSVLGKIENMIKDRLNCRKPFKILDLGIGTGALTTQLYKQGMKITGIDFSEEMLKISKEKMPEAKVFCYNLAFGIPREIDNRQFDYIVSTYALHHIKNDLKPLCFKHIANYFKKGGQIIIGDIAFENRERCLECKDRAGREWDEAEAEHYFVWADFKEFLEKEFDATYEQISQCAGLLTIKRKCF